MQAEASTPVAVPARERVLSTAYHLFAHRGIRDVGVDEIIARSRVAKATFYKHFPSKDDLVLAFLARRERLWTEEFVAAGARSRAADAEQRLLAIFEIFDEWFAETDDYEACAFVNVLLEMGREHRLGRASIDHLANIRALVCEWAREAGLRDPEEFAHSLHLLMKGSIVAAAEGDRRAARRAAAMARDLIEAHRR